MEQTFIRLNDGCVIPQFGFGVYLVPGDEAARVACLEALRIGYRHIDTAHAYQNERGVGQAVRESGINRHDIWITSKLWPHEYGEGKTLPAIDRMLQRLGTDYIDLLLLHQEHGDYVGAYKEMERAVAAGKVRSIGLSNFESNRTLDEILESAAILPSTHQVECHPYFQQDVLKRKMQPYGTVVESWFPLGHADQNLLNEPLFSQLAAKYGKTNAQIILRWHIQEGNIVFPKSTNPVHIKENADIFDFELTADEMALIKKMDRNQRFYNTTYEEQARIVKNFTPAD